MTTVRIAAAQTPEFREDVEAALACLGEMSARTEAAGARLLCFPEGFLQGYLTGEVVAQLPLNAPGLLVYDLPC